MKNTVESKTSFFNISNSIESTLNFLDEINLFQRKIFLLILDIILLFGALTLTTYLKFGSMTFYFEDIWYNLLIISIMILSFYLSNLYSSLWRYASIEELLFIVKGCFIGSLFSYIILFLANRIDTITIPIIFFILSTTLIGGFRFSYRLFRRAIMGIKSTDLQRSRVMIIGGGEAGAMLIKELFSTSETFKYPVGIIDDNCNKQKCKIHGVPVVGTSDDIVQKSKDLRIDEIVIAMPSASNLERRRIFEICKNTKCKIRTLPGIYKLVDGKVDVQKIRDVEIEDLLGREPISVDLQEITSYIKGEVVLVTGGGGSIGSELCRQIAKFQPKLLILLDIYENNAYETQQELIRKHGDNLNLEVLIASVRDKHRLEMIFTKYQPSIVFHAAAHKHVPLMETSPAEAIKNNVFGTQNVANCAHKYGSKRFVLISTDKAVNPTNIMGATKRLAEMIIQNMDKKSSTEFVAVRFGNVLGSNGSVIPLFKRQIAEGGPVTVTHPDIIRYFMTISEAVQLVIQAGSMAKGGEIFVLDMGEPVKIVDLAKDLIKFSGFEPDVDIKIEFSGLRPGEKLYEELLMAEEGLTETSHTKIFIGKPIEINPMELSQKLDVLQKFVNGDQAELISQMMEKIVPTYKKVV